MFGLVEIRFCQRAANDSVDAGEDDVVQRCEGQKQFGKGFLVPDVPGNTVDSTLARAGLGECGFETLDCYIDTPRGGRDYGHAGTSLEEDLGRSEADSFGSTERLVTA